MIKLQGKISANLKINILTSFQVRTHQKSGQNTQQLNKKSKESLKPILYEIYQRYFNIHCHNIESCNKGTGIQCFFGIKL